MTPEIPIDLFLKPGELYFGDGPGHVRTLLGSCVGITLWHPARRVGGMCHFVLPSRGTKDKGDGRYGDEAMVFFANRAQELSLRMPEFQAGLFGGGNMFPGFSDFGGSTPIGEQNVAMARELVRSYGLVVMKESLGKFCYRYISLDLNDGNLLVRTSDVRRE